MPAAARFVVALALGQLLIAAWAGWALALARIDPTAAWAHGLRALHSESALIGAWSGLPIGVAWWILPRPGGLRPGAARLVAGALLLHVGVWAAGAGVGAGNLVAMAGLCVAASPLFGRLRRLPSPVGSGAAR